MKKVVFSTALFLMILVILRIGKFIFAPLIVSGILAALLSNIVAALEQKNFKPVLASFTVTVLLFLVIGGLFTVIVFQYVNVLDELPEWGDKISAKLESLVDYAATSWGLSASTINSTLAEVKSGLQSNAADAVGSVWTYFINAISILFLIPVFTFFMIFYRAKLNRLIELWLERRSKTKKQSIQIIKEAKEGVSKYLKGLLFVMFILACLNTIGLAILGVPYYILLGTTAALLSVIPYLGNVVGGGVAVIVAYASSGNYWLAIGVIVLFAAIQILEGNLITPLVMKDQVNINPFSVILALLIGGAVWGILGMIVSVPALAIIKVYMERDSNLKEYAKLLGDE
ncbi:AI-2E family transporter [bacterium]|nr:AI-2E family transporter [bacterium]